MQKLKHSQRHSPKRVVVLGPVFATVALITLTALTALQGCSAGATGDSISGGGPGATVTSETIQGERANFIQGGDAQRTRVYDAVSGPRFGDVLWENKEVHADGSPVIVTGDLGFIRVSDDELGVVDLGTGKVLCTLRSPEEHSTRTAMPTVPTVADGVLYYQGAEGLHAWDLTGKKDLWVFKTKYVGHSPVVQDGTVYFGASENGPFAEGGYLVAVDAATGREKWRFKAGKVSYPAIGGGMIYFQGGELLRQGDFFQDNSPLYALDLQNGNLVWKREPEGGKSAPESYGHPVYYDGMVYAPLDSNSATGNGAGELHALDARTGKVVWKQWGDTLKWDPEEIAAYDGTIYLTVQVRGIYRAYIHTFDAKSGEKRWSFEAGSRLEAPSIASGTLYLSGTVFNEDRGVLYSLDPRTGTVLDKKEFDAILRGSPAIANGVVYLPGRLSEREENLVLAVQTLGVKGP